MTASYKTEQFSPTFSGSLQIFYKVFSFSFFFVLMISSINPAFVWFLQFPRLKNWFKSYLVGGGEGVWVGVLAWLLLLKDQIIKKCQKVQDLYQIFISDAKALYYDSCQKERESDSLSPTSNLSLMIHFIFSQKKNWDIWTRFSSTKQPSGELLNGVVSIFVFVLSSLHHF